MKTRISKRGDIGITDIARGLIIAAGTSALLVIQQSLDAGIWTFNYKAIGMAALSGGVAYIFKNLLEPSKVITVTKSDESAKQVKDILDEKIN